MKISDDNWPVKTELLPEITQIVTVNWLCCIQLMAAFFPVKYFFLFIPPIKLCCVLLLVFFSIWASAIMRPSMSLYHEQASKFFCSAVGFNLSQNDTVHILSTLSHQIGIVLSKVNVELLVDVVDNTNVHTPPVIS